MELRNALLAEALAEERRNALLAVALTKERRSGRTNSTVLQGGDMRSPLPAIASAKTERM